MKYRNTKTGFVFESKSEVNAEGWELVSQPSKVEKKAAEPKPTTKKRKPN